MMISQNQTAYAPHPAIVVSDNGGSPSSFSSSSARSQHSDSHRFQPEEADAPRHQPVFKKGPRGKPVNPLEALAMLASAEVEQSTPGSPASSSSRPELVSSSSEESFSSSPKSKTRNSPPKASSSQTDDVDSNAISKNDVLCGRGGLTNHHPGNVFFRRLVRLKQEEYLMASKREKAGVSKEIVELIRGLQPSGRFLKRDPKNPGVWVEIGDRKAREKTSQALREGAPELREEIQTSMAAAESQPPKRRTMTARQQEPRPEKRTSPTPSAPAAFLDPYHQQQHSHQHSPYHHHGPAPEMVHSNRARVVSDDNVAGSGNIQGIRPSRFEHPPPLHHQRLGSYHGYHHHHPHHHAPAVHHYEHIAPPPPSSYEAHLQHYAERQLHIATPPPAPRHVIPAAPASMPEPPTMCESLSTPAAASSSGHKRKLPPKQEAQSNKFLRKGSAGPRLKLLKSRLAKCEF